MLTNNAVLAVIGRVKVRVMKQVSLLILALFWVTTSTAAEGWLIATDNERLNRSGILSVDIVKPSDVTEWPKVITLKLTSEQGEEQLQLSLTQNTQNTIRGNYTGITPPTLSGNVQIELVGHSSNRLLMVTNDTPAAPVIVAKNTVEPAKVSTDVETEEKPFKRVYISDPEEDRTITANEPLYFIIGSSDERDFDARFQISFKYRPFDPDARISKFIPYASNMYFAYTQTSIWDLGSESSPFRDTSYRPSIYYNWNESGNGWNPNSWKFGLEHESNGRDGEESRSMNIAFVQPIWNLDYSGGKRFTFMPRFYAYIEKSDNTDMQEYRGYVDWIMRYGRDDAAILTAMYRQGTRGYAQGQVDLSYPISDKIFGRTGTFLHFQLLGGYGETLIDYDKRSDVQLRMGLSLAR